MGTIIIRNTSEQSKDSRRSMRTYRWKIYLETSPEYLLDRIKKVEYHLHPTFPVKDIVSNDRKTNFKIEGTGWGEFSVGIDIFTDKDVKISHSHYLTLLRSNETAFRVELSNFSPLQI